MFLQELRVSGFRSFEHQAVILQRELTVFVGENNGGKSNAIDAMRLLTLPLSGRREIYCEPTDVRFQRTVSHFELEAHFTELSAGQQGRLISAATDATLSKACFGLRYDGARAGARPTLWAGRRGNAPEPNCFDTVRHVYLPALRDAKRSLASGNPTRIMTLLTHFLEGTSPTELARNLARTPGHEILRKVDVAVQDRLSMLTSGVRQQAASLGFSTDETLIDIARDLRFKLADYGVQPEDLRYSGHGYANLLFMATIAVELEKVRTADLTLFLVEEPEAHLHPQLQAAVLSFLRDQAEASRRHPSGDDHGPAGELQVVVATHSPNLSSWVSSDRLVVFKSVSVPDTIGAPAAVDPTAESTTAALGQSRDGRPAPAIRRSTRCLPLASMKLTEADRRKVDRYLDVTKAALLFGGRVLLVEGIAEALLLPVIAKHHTLKDRLDEQRVFRSAVFVPIEGVDFAPYVTLLLTAVGDARIADRVVVVTDGDKATGAVGADPLAKDSSGSVRRAPKMTPGETRKSVLESLVRQLGATEQFAAITSTYSLETELVEAGNADLLKAAYLRLHPCSEDKWHSAVESTGDDRAKKVHSIFESTRKGDFAQLLAELIESNAAFKVPPYLATAIEELVRS